MKAYCRSIGLLFVVTAILTSLCGIASARGKAPVVPLTEQGQKLQKHYADILDSLREEITASLPSVDKQKKAAFLDARAKLGGLKAPGENATPAAVTRYKAASAQAEANALQAARAVLAGLDGLLASDKLDSKLMATAIIRHGTPRGLAEFAQQGEQEKALLDKLFAGEALMKQILISGGANGGEYGEAMQVYAAIQTASERARERGSVFQRLALGTALHQPWLAGKETGGVYGIVYADHQAPDGQVARYLHFEKAHLGGELDPAFKDMNAWECRFITNDPYTDEELGWVREMMRNYRPDHITNPDYKWRYTRIVKSDVPYASPVWDPERGTKTQQMIAGGGKCGPRAFFGRFATRAFGIPARRSTQRGHAAMNHWTPDGWVVCFGGWWSFNWCGPWGGLDFLLDSQAREHPKEYMKVLRAQWIGDALGEADVSIRNYGAGGGFWDGLAFYKKRAVVDEAKTAELGKELVGLSAEESRLLGESDKILGDKKGEAINIPEKDRTIIVGKDGVITIPAAACFKPTNNTDKIAFMASSGGGTQVHYARLGKRPELLRYTVELPAAGKYELTARVATVSVKQQAIFRLNRRTLINLPLPYTKGMWAKTKSQMVAMFKGKNTFGITCRVPNRGVSIKELTLTPVR